MQQQRHRVRSGPHQVAPMPFGVTPGVLIVGGLWAGKVFLRGVRHTFS
jgi:hypothetical protein